jgi:hypothetical protein
MKRIIPLGRYLLVFALCAGLITGCKGTEKKKPAKSEPPVGQISAQPVEPGRMSSFPPIPIALAPGEASGDNIFQNAGFEGGDAPWSLAGGSGKPALTQSLCAEGKSSLQVEPTPSGDVFAYQTPALTPRSFYSLQALVFTSGAGEATPEVRDKAGNVLISGDSVKGPVAAWTPAGLIFVTGAAPSEIEVGFKVSGGASVLIDKCFFSPLPTINVFDAGTMENAPSEDKMAIWYLKGAQLNPVTPGHDSEHALELPMSGESDSSITGLIDLKTLRGQRVWISAMIKSVGEGTAPGPEVTMEWKCPGSGSNATASSTCAPSGDWADAGIFAEIAPKDESQQAVGQSPLGNLSFTRPAGVKGQVLIDDVAIFFVLEDGFKGGAFLPAPSK